MKEKFFRRAMPFILIAVCAAFVCAAFFACAFSLESENGLTPRNFGDDGNYAVPADNSGRGINLAQGNPSLLSHPEVLNVVVFICFSDESVSEAFPSQVTDNVMECLSGDAGSLADYYNRLSFGAFSVRSVSAKRNSAYYVYKAPYTRSYYESVTEETGVKRYNPESTLLNGAINAANDYLNLPASSLDVNGDGFVDSVAFVISGNYSEKSWGHLMWPHSWNLNKISRLSSGKTNSASIAGVHVDNYTFTFAQPFKVGLIAHEFGHILGLPDLYHYGADTEYLPVGYWDLMHNECETPQFMLAYTRQKYLGFLSKSQTPEITTGGVYTLKPAALATGEDVVAYKITLSSLESIWLEYRVNGPGSYDVDLPGSGLVVYRVNNSVIGNTSGRHNNTTSPDEIFVYRPSLATSAQGSLSKQERYNLDRAALSKFENNSSLGNTSKTSKFSSDCIYLTNGANTRIKVEITAQSASEIKFSVDLGPYDCEYIGDSYVTGTDLKGKTVKNEHHMFYGDDVNVSVLLKYANRPTAIELTDFTVEFEQYVCPGGQTAYAVFADGAGERRIPFVLYIYDSVRTEATVTRYPDSTSISIGEQLDLSGLAISINYLSGNKEAVYYDRTSPNDWVIVEGLDVNRHGTYDHVLIKYRDSAYFTLSGIKVLGTIVSLRVEELNSLRLIGTELNHAFNVIGTFEDGTERALKETEYTEETVGNTYFERSVVRIASTENPTVTTETYGFNVEPSATVKMVSVGKLPDRTTFDFAEEPSFVGGKITVFFQTSDNGSRSVELNMENYAASLLKNYKYGASGEKRLLGQVGPCSFELKITVLPKSSSLLSVALDKKDIITVNDADMSVALKSPMSLGELASYLNSSLTVAFIDTEQGYDMPLSAFSSRAAGGNVTLCLKSTSGAKVLTYSVYLIGDSNGDGEVNDNDVSGWISSMLSGNKYASNLDADGDGFYTLNDFVLLLRLKEGE